MSHRSQSVQLPSESECESESESESGSGSGTGSESESEEEQELVECGQHVSMQRSDAHHEVRQCGSAVREASCGPQPALQDYFAHLTKQYDCAMSLESHIDPRRSCQKSKQWEKESGCTCTSHKSHSNTNKYIGYAQNNSNGHCTCLTKEDRMEHVSSKATTAKKGKEEHGYESNLVNSGRVGHVGKNNNDSRYISQKYSTIPQSSWSNLNKGKIESKYAYDENKFENNRHVGYGVNHLGAGYSIPPSPYKPKLNKGKVESVYAYDENKFDTNQHVGYGVNHLGAGYSIPPSTCTPKSKKEKIQNRCAYEESDFDNNKHVEYGANYLGAGYSIPSLTCKTKPKKEKIESGHVYDESDFDNNQLVECGPNKNYHMTYNGTKKSSSSTSVASSKRITYM